MTRTSRLSARVAKVRVGKAVRFLLPPRLLLPAGRKSLF